MFDCLFVCWFVGLFVCLFLFVWMQGMSGERGVCVCDEVGLFVCLFDCFVVCWLLVYQLISFGVRVLLFRVHVIWCIFV